MGIKPDHWIRRMAKEHGMIEPFVEASVRKDVVSYGVSSYGYDIRVSNEFKIFTNVNSAIVDPKNFVSDSFVDFVGDVCIIPPNSFVLSRTVEYLRIPRDVLTICVGKCLSGDTRVVDAETGDYLPIRDFAHAQRTLSLKGWHTHEAHVSDWIPQGTKPIYRLTTRTGLQIKATANHPFRQLHGWTQLCNLKPGDRIAAARELPVFGTTPLPNWEAALLGMMIAEGQCDTPGHSPTFTTSDAVMVDLFRACVATGLESEVSHNGAMGYRIVNRKGRGGIMTGHPNRARIWLESHGLVVKADYKFVPQAVFTAAKESIAVFLRALFSGDGSIQQHGESVAFEYYSNSRRLVEDVHHLLLRFGIVSLIREKKAWTGKPAYKIQITDVIQIEKFATEIGFWPGSVKQQKLEKVAMPFITTHPKHKSNFDTLPTEAVPLMREAAYSVGKSMRQLSVEGTSSKQSLGFVNATRVARAAPHSELAQLVDAGPVWDTVEKIEYVGEEEVFDLSVPDVHNFVANDLFVHNSTYARCGLIVNVTPLEPCFSDDTDILTPEGWRPIKTMQVGDCVMGMDNNGFAEYQPILAKQEYDFTGDLLHFDGRSIDLLVTPDHKLLVNRRTNGRATRKGPEKTGWHTATAAEVFGKHNYEMTRELRWQGTAVDEFLEINGERYPTETFLKFLGVWLGDGSAYIPKKSGKPSGYIVQIAAFNHKRDYVKNLLNAMGVHYFEMKEGYRFYSKSLFEYLQFFRGSGNKRVPREWFKLPPHQIKWLLEGLVMSDGNEQTQTITTTSHQLADDIQVLAFLSGSAAIIRRIPSSTFPTRQLNGYEIHSNRDVFKIRIVNDHMTPKIRPSCHKLVPYNGKVYDVTVPNHLIFVRRNGKAVWSGNCWEGYLTLEVSNTTPLPAKVYANEGIAQLLFLGGDGECEVSYADKKGKYQGQVGVVLPRIEK